MKAAVSITGYTDGSKSCNLIIPDKNGVNKSFSITNKQAQSFIKELGLQENKSFSKQNGLSFFKYYS
jgi:hypothetical protein